MNFFSIILYALGILIGVLGILLGVAMIICPAPVAQLPVQHSAVESVASLPDTTDDVESFPPYTIAECSEDGLFVRVVAHGGATPDEASDIISAYAKSYKRIDICEPGHISRGEECMSYMDGILVDYVSGKTKAIEL